MKVFLWVALSVSLSGVLLFNVWEKVDIVLVGYELKALLKKKAVLEQQHDRLQSRFSQLMAPERIASEVNKKLGMKPPRARQVILVSSGTEHGKPRDGLESPLRLTQQTGP